MQQNKAVHLWFRLLAEELNNAGMDMVKFLDEGTEIPWTEHSVKESIWKPVQKVMYGKDSTKELITTEYTEVYEVINRKMSERGIHVGWPDEYSRSLNNKY